MPRRRRRPGGGLGAIAPTEARLLRVMGEPKRRRRPHRGRPQRPGGPGRAAPTRARLLALRVLERVQRAGAYADLALHAQLGRTDLPAGDRAFATDLVRGTLRWRGRLDFLLSQLVDRDLEKLEPLVANALPQAGDSAALWPDPAEQRWRRVNSAVLAIHPGEEGPLIRMVGTADDGLAVGRLVDVYRNRSHVAVALIIATADPLSDAQVIESASRLAPAVGDRLVLAVPPLVVPEPEHVALPLVLSEADVELYKEIFELQVQAKWQVADYLTDKLEDKRLIAYILAQRYLHPTGYRSSYTELRTWLAK